MSLKRQVFDGGTVQGTKKIPPKKESLIPHFRIHLAVKERQIQNGTN